MNFNPYRRQGVGCNGPLVWARCGPALQGNKLNPLIVLADIKHIQIETFEHRLSDKHRRIPTSVIEATNRSIAQASQKARPKAFQFNDYSKSSCTIEKLSKTGTPNSPSKKVMDGAGLNFSR